VADRLPLRRHDAVAVDIGHEGSVTAPAGCVYAVETRSFEADYRCGGRGSKRVQRGGFASERDASEALGRALERLRPERRLSQSLTLAELVDEYLAQHDAEPVTIAKLRWLLGKAVTAFGDLRISELRPQELRWHWTRDESNPKRVSGSEYARQIGKGHVVVNR